MSKTSLVRELEMRGYLSLNKFVKYLKEYHPGAYVSYPTALKLVESRKLRAYKAGSHYRITQHEIERWVTEGNWERSFGASSFLGDYEGGM